MKIVKIKGGLGNQIFQYAFAKYLEKTTNDVIKLDTTYFDKILNDRIRIFHLDKFQIDLDIATENEIKSKLIFKSIKKFDSKGFIYKFLTSLESMLNKLYYKESFNKKLNINFLEKHDYFDGYFQDLFFLEKVVSEMKLFFQQFHFKYKRYNEDFIKIANENSIFIGVRKGDYIKTQRAKKKFGNLGVSYFLESVKYMNLLITNPKYYIFTDDPEWLMNNMGKNTLDNNFEFIFSKNYTDIEEFALMSFCKNAIISNSTFHFWAAWLIENKEKKIIAPYPWKLNEKVNIVPKDWLLMERK